MKPAYAIAEPITPQMVKKRTGAIKSKLIEALRESPGTASELGAVLFPRMKLRASQRRCSAMCCWLRSRGIVKVIGRVNREGYRDKTGRMMSNLFALELENP